MQEDELREKISDFMSELMVEVSLAKLDTPLTPRSGLRFIKAHNTKLDEILSYIKQYSKDYADTDCTIYQERELSIVDPNTKEDR